MDFASLDNTLSPSQLITDYQHDLPRTSARDGERVSILSLPAEILLRITHLLTLPPYRPNNVHAVPDITSTTPGTVTPSIRTLKSLRLAHPDFQYLPLPYLFSQLTLPLWGPKGLHRLYQISQHEHLATHVQHVKFWVQFNLATPHPAPFSEMNLRRGSQDLLSIRDPPPRKRDKWRSSISGALEGRLGGLSLSGKGKGKERKSSKVPTAAVTSGAGDKAEGAVRRASTASASGTNGDIVVALQGRQSSFPPLPDYKTDPMEFLATFDKMAQTTISRNLALAEITVAAEKNVGPSPMLLAMLGFLSETLGQLSRLQTLCVDSQTQEEFMERLDRGYALRYAPTQDTWEAISGYIVAMIVAGWVRSSCQGLKRLWVMGGAVGWGRVLMREYLASERRQEGMVWMENGFERKEAACTNGSEEQTGLDMWRKKALRLQSLTLRYDVGAYRKYLSEVETQWLGMVKELIQDMPRLQYLEIGEQKRADGKTQDWTSTRRAPVKLSNIARRGWQDGQSAADLKMLRLGDFQVRDPSDLKNCLEALAGERLQCLYMGSVGIQTNDWPTAWRMLREDCHFRLKQFALIGKIYESTYGYWTPNQHWLARWDGDISCLGNAPSLLELVQDYVGGKGGDEPFPLLVTEQVGVGAAFDQWQRRSDETLKYTPLPRGA